MSSRAAATAACSRSGSCPSSLGRWRQLSRLGFNELTALSPIAGFAIGLVAGLRLSATSPTYLKGMLAAGCFVGVARAISVVRTDGRVIDTIVNGVAAPFSSAPAYAAAVLMVLAHALLNVEVPSVIGQAVLAMPIMAPSSDLLGISRDAAVIAYQTGAGLMDMTTHTNGALLAAHLGGSCRVGGAAFSEPSASKRLTPNIGRPHSGTKNGRDSA